MTPKPPVDAFTLNPALDREKLAAHYARNGRVHIAEVLTPDSAARLHKALSEETAYNLTVNSGDKYFDLPEAQVRALSPQQLQTLTDSAGAGTQKGFQLYYETHRLTDSGEPYRDPTSVLAKLVAFLEGEELLSFVRTVTGEDGIAFADAQATRYGPGHFLTTHDDGIAGKNRVAGYIFNMTPFWQADWGGILLFIDKDGQVAEGFVPCFNALNILKVPQPHLVSQVAPFARAKRLSVTGWFRAK